MNHKNQTYNELIGQIKAKTPELGNPELFTSDILSAVHRLPHKPKPNRSLRLVAWTSSVAAVLLLGWFVSELSPPVQAFDQNVYSPTLSYHSSMQAEITEEGSTLDKINSVIREKRERKEARAAFYTSIIHRN